MESFFDLSQKYKNEIENSPKILGALALYTNSMDSRTLADIIDNNQDYHRAKKIPLPHLGTGTTNTHFQLGKLESGAWIATRERHWYTIYNLRDVLENYSQEIAACADEGGLTSKFCVGVKVHDQRKKTAPANMKKERLLLLIEDLTRGYSSDFHPAGYKEHFGTLDGRKVFHDPFDNFDKVEIYQFMSDESMTHLSP